MMNYQECRFSRRRTCFGVPKKNSDKVVRTPRAGPDDDFHVKNGAGPGRVQGGSKGGAAV
jgi:hypothetical protein